MDDYVEVYTASDVTFAYLMKANLESSGIPVQINNENLQGAYCLDGMVPSVLVPASHVEQAKQIIKEIQQSSEDEQGQSLPKRENNMIDRADIMIKIPETHEFEAAGWIVHRWRYKNDEDVTVLQRESFRISWFATKLVTYVFLIPRGVGSFSEVVDDYASLRKFAGKNKRTLLPFTLQCGYAILPIYISNSFPHQVIQDVRTTCKKRWCVLHVPSLLEIETGSLHTLEAKSFWGSVYRDYIKITISEIANMVQFKTV